MMIKYSFFVNGNLDGIIQNIEKIKGKIIQKLKELNSIY